MLFIKFQRFEMDKNINIAGTGLGMAITKGLVELMNGEIDLGDIAIEQLALVLDDHPRKDGEEFSAIIEDVSPVKNNPFAAALCSPFFRH